MDDDVLGHAADGRTYTNFVGFGDETDVRKIELAHAAKVSFTLVSAAAAKLVVYSEAGKAAVKGAAEKILQAGTYYVSVQSARAKKGDEAYYNVSVDGTFYNDGDDGTNDCLWTKSGGWNGAVVDSEAKALTAGAFLIDAGELEVERGGTVYANFVGTGDTGDVVKIHANAGMTVSFKVAATEAVNFVIYERALKKGKHSQTVLLTAKLTEKNGFRNDAISCTFKTDGDFYVGVFSAKAKNGSEAYYNVEVASLSGSNDAALDAPVPSGLAMPEAFVGSSSTDGLSFGSCGDAANSLADVSAASAPDALAGRPMWLDTAALA